MNRITVFPDKRLHALGDLYGIFFEDINHAADGGLYAEMVRNRSFEFDRIDNYSYDHLTGWEKAGGGEFKIWVESVHPINENNLNYLAIDVAAGEGGVRNRGFNGKMPIKKGEEYIFSFYARRVKNFKSDVRITLVSAENGEKAGEASLKITGCDWKKYEGVIKAEKSLPCALEIVAEGEGRIYFDEISLFPKRTFKGRKNGMREDIALMLKELGPKFMRFPGGCLVHDGSLDKNARDSLYRWKNTIGGVEKRPARRNNWGYNQTLGLGFYEYFLFCEDIGAKPLPVLPGAYNPHRKDAVPLDELDEWVEDALDLIEFARGGENTKYGKIRAELGHKEPFGLEYIAIGNEEVGDEFFERYPYFHKAIKEKYPDIKIIGTSGPFPCGGEFEKGWRSARENGTDIVDEHYYVSPEWFLANYDRYFNYDKTGPKVFLGEYASWGNTLYNALCEAVYMTALEKSGTVALACYAPLLANSAYVNWRPDLIWFDEKSVFGSANYYVQKLFMAHQGKYEVLCENESEDETDVLSFAPNGTIELETVNTKARFYDLKIDGEAFEVSESEKDGRRVYKSDALEKKRESFVLEMKAEEIEGIRGFTIKFGMSENIYYRWEIGGWQNQDSVLCSHINGRESVLAHELKSVERGREYDIRLEVCGNAVECFIDGVKIHSVKILPAVIRPIYTAASVEEDKVYIKAVNIKGTPRLCEIETNCDIRSAEAEVLTGEPQDMNSFEEKEKVSPKALEISFSGSVVKAQMPPMSLCVITVKR